MKLEELDKMAYEMQVLPDGLTMPETYYFLTMRALYAMFLTGKITEHQAKEEKHIVLELYRQLDLSRRVGEHEMRILRQVQEQGGYYEENGCRVCRQLAHQLCGLPAELAQKGDD